VLTASSFHAFPQPLPDPVPVAVAVTGVITGIGAIVVTGAVDAADGEGTAARGRSRGSTVATV
jgi:hypothetical protein